MTIKYKICKQFELICIQDKLPIEYEYVIYQLSKNTGLQTINTVLRRNYIIEYNMKCSTKDSKKMIIKWSKK